MSKLRCLLTVALVSAILSGATSAFAAQAAQNPQTSASFALASDRMTYRLEFTGPQLERVQLFGEVFTKLYMEGTMSGGDFGAPVLPIAPVRLLLPQGTDVSTIEIVTNEMVEIDPAMQGFDLMAEPIVPSQPPVPIGYAAPTELSFDETAYISQEPLPGTLYGDVKVGSSRGYSILTLK
jgi:hypothetical protein